MKRKGEKIRVPFKPFKKRVQWGFDPKSKVIPDKRRKLHEKDLRKEDN
jgi:hypothetical protein